MFFILLTFAAALLIEGLGSLVSVIGISALFGANPIIIVLAVALDIGKIVVVSLLYTYWKQLSKLMKSYALLAAAVTMTITSAGAAGYLSGEFQKAILGTKEGELAVSVLKEQQAKYQERKTQIDNQIANLPARTTVNQRLRLMNGFKAEQQELDRKIAEIDTKLPEMQIKQIGTEAKAGPIIAVAKAFNISVEEAVKWVILMIIFVFDPLAIFLIIAGNFLVAHRKAGDAPHMNVWEEKPVVEVEKHEEPPARDLYTQWKEADEFVERDPEPIVTRMYPSFKEGDSLPPVESKDVEVYADIGKPMYNLEKLREKVEGPTDEDVDAFIKQIEHRDSGPTVVQSGVLSPVIVEDVQTPVKPLQEITKSSLGLVKEDANTIVSADQREFGFNRARAKARTTPVKK